MAWRLSLLVVLTAALAVAGAAFLSRQPPPPAKTPLGRTVADFTLRDSHGQPHSLRDLDEQRLVVVVFVGTACPVNQRYAPRLAELAREFGPRGVAFLGVNANAQDSLADVAAYVRTHQLPFPVLKDPDNAVADQMGAVRTPEAFVLDQHRVVRYWGRIDDQYGVGVRRPEPTRRDLAEALEELLAGKPVSCLVAAASGCRIGRTLRVPAHGDVTYANQVSRLLQRRCVECHRDGQVAPFPLTSYRDAAGWAAMMREVVAAGRMPPWFADPAHGRFRNDPRLSDDEKQTLFRWIDDGCPEGDPADLPPPAAFPDGWRIPTPDQVLAMDAQPFAVPAEGELLYQYFFVDPGFTEDKLIRAAEVRPGSPAVVHHALVLIAPPGDDGPTLDSAGALLDYAPGMTPMVLPDGMALRVPAGSRFVFQMHYTPNGTPQQDRTRLGLVFADPAAVKKEVRGGAVVNRAIDIPPEAADYRLTAEQRLDADALLLSLSPHLHLRGRAFRVEAVFPDGRREVLLDVPRYDFNWQLRYDLAEPKRLPRGTRLVCTARWDNSKANPANPDPTRRVTWGDQTADEMLIGFFATAPAACGLAGER